MPTKLDNDNHAPFYAPDDIAELDVASKKPIGPGETHTLYIETNEPLLIEELRVPEECAEHFLVHDITCGGEQALMGSPPPEGLRFTKFGPPLHSEVMGGKKLSITVKNISSSPRDFEATFCGRRAADVDAWRNGAVVEPLHAIAEKLLRSGIGPDKIMGVIAEHLHDICSPSTSIVYGMDTGKDSGPFDEGANMGIEVTPFREHALARLLMSESIAECLELEGLEVRPPGGKIARGELLMREPDDSGTRLWELAEPLVVAPMDTVRVNIRITKPIDRVTLTALGDQTPQDRVLQTLLNAATASSDETVRLCAQVYQRTCDEWQERKKAQRIHEEDGQTLH